MNTMIGPGSDRTAMELLGGGGLALLPWTKHLLAALWEQVRLLLQVIYCTFISGESRHSLRIQFFPLSPFSVCLYVTIDFIINILRFFFNSFSLPFANRYAFSAARAL